MKQVVIKDPLYDFEVSVYVGGDFEDIKKEMNLDLGTSVGRLRGMFGEVEGSQYFLWIENLNNIPYLAHEVLHLAICEFRIKGMELNEGSEEALVYLYEWWLSQILKLKNKK